MNVKIPKPARGAAAPQPQENIQSYSTVGFGRRSRWPYPPVGEAARRDPHIPDPTPGLERPQIQQDDPQVAEPVERVGEYHAGGGIDYNGFPAALTFAKRLGNAMTRTLARNLLVANVDSRWRVGGVSLPPDFGFGMGAGMDAAAYWPNNPQTYLRNPGITPLANAPQTFRYAPNMGIQDVGPSIADIGSILSK